MNQTEQSNDWRAAGRLLQWGLQPHARPTLDEEYLALVKHYLLTPEFQRHVRDVALGLGLVVLECEEQRGLILTPMADGVFSMKPAEFRPTATSADVRFIDGLVQVAIATTVYPRSADLDADRQFARLPITVSDVEHTIGILCDELAAAAKAQPDPEDAHVASGLLEGWRVWSALPEAKATRDGRRGQATRRRYIEQNLEWLVPLGCFRRETVRGEVAYRPTYRYQVQMQDFAAGEIYDTASQLLAAYAARDAVRDAARQAHAAPGVARGLNPATAPPVDHTADAATGGASGGASDGATDVGATVENTRETALETDREGETLDAGTDVAADVADSATADAVIDSAPDPASRTN